MGMGGEGHRLKCLEQMPSDAGDGLAGLGAGQGCILYVICWFISLWEGKGNLPGGLSLSWDILGLVVPKVLIPLCSPCCGNLVPTRAEYSPKSTKPMGLNQ